MRYERGYTNQFRASSLRQFLHVILAPLPEILKCNDFALQRLFCAFQIHTSSPDFFDGVHAQDQRIRVPLLSVEPVRIMQQVPCLLSR